MKSPFKIGDWVGAKAGAILMRPASEKEVSSAKCANGRNACFMTH